MFILWPFWPEDSSGLIIIFSLITTAWKFISLCLFPLWISPPSRWCHFGVIISCSSTTGCGRCRWLPSSPLASTPAACSPLSAAALLPPCQLVRFEWPWFSFRCSFFTIPAAWGTVPSGWAPSPSSGRSSSFRKPCGISLRSFPLRF